MTSTPDAIAAAVLSFEDRRDLTVPLAATRDALDDAAILECAEFGLSLRIADIMTSISLAPSGSAERRILDGRLEAAHRQRDRVRAAMVKT